jgi:hypothetical protein
MIVAPEIDTVNIKDFLVKSPSERLPFYSEQYLKGKKWDDITNSLKWGLTNTGNIKGLAMATILFPERKNEILRIFQDSGRDINRFFLDRSAYAKILYPDKFSDASHALPSPDIVQNNILLNDSTKSFLGNRLLNELIIYGDSFKSIGGIDVIRQTLEKNTDFYSFIEDIESISDNKVHSHDLRDYTFLNFLQNLSAKKILYGDQAEKLDKSEWQVLHNTLSLCQKKSMATHALIDSLAYMKILAAKQIKLTDKGIELDNDELDNLNQESDLPEVRRF